MNKTQLRQLIAENRLDEVLREMLTLTRGTRFEQDAVLLSSRYNEYKSLQIKNVESPAELERRRNQIVHALLSVLEQMPDSAPGGIDLPPTGAPVLSGTGDGVVRTGTGDGGSARTTSVWIGVLSLAAILAAILFVPCPTSAQFFVFRLILALGAAGIGSILPGFFHVESAGAKAGGALALFALVYLLNPAELVGDERCRQKPFTLTVSVRMQKPSTDYPELKDAELWLWQENDWKKAPVSPEGVADFKNLSPELIGKQTAVRWKGEFYKPAKDSLTIVPPAVTLDLTPDGSLERVFGKITDPKGLAFPGVAIEVEGRFDTTDAAGNYDLRIPPDLQKTHYLLHATAKGFKPYRGEVWPASGAMNFSMKK